MSVTFKEAFEIFSLPFFILVRKAHEFHTQYWDEQTVQVSDILSIKTGGCYENCSDCAQSIHNGCKMPRTPMLDIEIVVKAAKLAKERGASRFCMSTSGRSLSNPTEFDNMCKIIKAVHDLGMETCATMGFLTTEQAKRLKESGLDYYNHNVDTSPEYYNNIVTTRTI